MKKMYFVTNDKQQFMWEDGAFYNAFVKPAYAFDEETAKFYNTQYGYNIELADPEVWPQFYQKQEQPTRKEKRITRVRCTSFALASVLDALWDDHAVTELNVSKEDNEFLISFVYLREAPNVIAQQAIGIKEAL